MTSQRTTRLSLVVFCFALGTIQLTAQDSVGLVLTDRLHQAIIENSIDQPDMKPWHLVMDFELFKTGGNPAQTGTVEEWWAGPELHKITYSRGPSTWTEIVNDQGLYRSTSGEEPPELVRLLREQILHPLPPAGMIDQKTSTLESMQVGKVTLDCIRLALPLGEGQKHTPAEFDPAYCLDHNKTSLRISSTYDTIRFTRVSLGSFSGKSVAIDQGISFDGILAAKAHIATLQRVNPAMTEFVPTASMTRIGRNPVEAGGQFLDKRLLTRVNPTYPERARNNHTAGTVLLHASVGEDGKVKEVKMIHSPSYDLTEAAITAVRQWVYEPDTEDGTPTPVDTEIAVNFAFRNR